MQDLNIYLQGIILFTSQLVFIYYRTLNISAQIEHDRFKLFWSGAVTHITWLLGITIGVNAILEGTYWLVIISWLGGSLGADLGLRKQIKTKLKLK